MKKQKVIASGHGIILEKGEKSILKLIVVRSHTLNIIKAAELYTVNR